MRLNLLNPRKSLNNAFRKVKPERREIETFKHNLLQLLDSTNDGESEEHHKNLVIDFLKKTYYDPDHFVNTKGRTDLVIHTGHKADSPVGVIAETKKPNNRAEMVAENRVNVKAFQELLLYYLRERITLKKQDPTTDTTALEAEIDRLVYELYGLTEEEIRIVEESVG